MRTKSNATQDRPGGTKLRLVLLSDTHQLHREVDVPAGDILIHAGDLTVFSESIDEIADFNRWLGGLPQRHKIVVPGNHDFFLDTSSFGRALLSSATVLIDEGIEIQGLRVWGSPVTPMHEGAFALGSPRDRRRFYAEDYVPDFLTVLEAAIERIPLEATNPRW
jgi:predicted phosphohydrolase